MHNRMQGRHTFISDFISQNHWLFYVDFILFTTPFVFANYWHTLLDKKVNSIEHYIFIVKISFVVFIFFKVLLQLIIQKTQLN